jgi:hypothetical protein
LLSQSTLSVSTENKFKSDLKEIRKSSKEREERLKREFGEREKMNSDLIAQLMDMRIRITALEQELETSSAYFKQKPGKAYIIRLDPWNDKIVPVETDRFKDVQGNPIRRYEVKINNVNNGKQQQGIQARQSAHKLLEN